MKLQIIVGSDRPGRKSDKIAKWVALEAANLEGVDYEIVDLADYKMPLFNESVSPRYNPNYQPNEPAQAWLNKLQEADAYVFVTPEYNHSIPAVLKNAIDYITDQVTRKPATIVSHGTVGGARAAEHLKLILSEARIVPIPLAVTYAGTIGEEGAINEEGRADDSVTGSPYGPQAALKGALTELAWYANALKAARQS